MTASRGHNAVFLLNMGGPDSLDAIRPFLQNLFSDPDIMKFPGFIQKPLASWIAKKRAPKVRPHYERMGGKSPLVETTLKQAKALEEALGEGFSVHVAMRYWNPRADEAVKAAKALNPTSIVVLPLYPHYSKATTGTSIKDLDASLAAHGLGDLPRATVKSFEDYPPYVEALSSSLREVLAGNKGTTVIFSAHGLPQSLIDAGDPYLDHIKATVGAVMVNFEGVPHRLAFQSRAGPVKWLSPSVEETLSALAKEGVKDVTLVAVSFVSDHIETLIEIDEQFRDYAKGLGITGFRRAPMLGTRTDFIRALKERVLLSLNDLKNL